MRVLVIICSIMSAAVIFMLGGLSIFFTGGFGFDSSTPYNYPPRVVGTVAFLAPGFIVALIAPGFALYDAARRGQVSWFIGLLAWPQAPALAAGLMFAGVLASPDSWWLALIFTPLAPFIYAVAAPSAASASNIGKPVASASPRFIVFVVTLVVVTLGGLALLFPGVHQTGSAIPSGPPALPVTQSASIASCSNGSYPTITLTNTGRQTLQWTAVSHGPNVTASPAGGSLAAGATATISLHGVTTAPDVIVMFQAGGQGSPAKFGCQAGVGK